MCVIYTNVNGTSFLTCDIANSGKWKPASLLTLSYREHYPEDIKYCPYCGKKLKRIDKKK